MAMPRDGATGELTSTDVVLTCATCGRALDGDPDEDATGDTGRPICGECARETDFFVLDIADGELDDDWDAD